MNITFKIIISVLAINLAACSSHYAPVSDKYGGKYESRSGEYVCRNISPYKGKVIGSGECVDLVKRCAGAPHTSQWKPGGKVVGQPLTPGTAIATFKRGKYPNKSGYHAAIYSHQTSEGRNLCLGSMAWKISSLEIDQSQTVE